jgi:hypothetical protein
MEELKAVNPRGGIRTQVSVFTLQAAARQRYYRPCPDAAQKAQNHPAASGESMFDRIRHGSVRAIALLACAWIAAPASVFAGAPAPDARQLGVTESLLTYCSRVDPPTAGAYRARIKQLVQGTSEETLVNVRNSDEYRQARASLDDFVSNVNERNAKRMCTNGLKTHH